MFLTKTKSLLEAQRDASQRVARARRYSVDLPIVGRVMVPPPEQLAIYAALGGLAVLELIDWPVAVAMGVGSTLVARRLSDLQAREDQLADTIEAGTTEPAIEPTAEPAAEPAMAAKKAPARKTPARKAPARKAAAKKAPAKAAKAAEAVKTVKTAEAAKTPARKNPATKAAKKAPPAG